jgi:hypothetical protein
MGKPAPAKEVLGISMACYLMMHSSAASLKLAASIRDIWHDTTEQRGEMKKQGGVEIGRQTAKLQQQAG